MATWYSKALGDGIDSLKPTTQIQEAYLALDEVARLPVDCAVFSYYDMRTNIVTVYFSPTAKHLADLFDASPCAKPKNKEGFGLIVGDMRAWDLLFPV